MKAEPSIRTSHNERIFDHKAMIGLIGLSPIIIMATSFVSSIITLLSLMFVLILTKAFYSFKDFLFEKRFKFLYMILLVSFFSTLVDLFIQTKLYDFHQKSNLFILIIAAHSLLFVSVLNAAPKIGVQNTLSNIKIIRSFSLLLIAQGLIRELFAYGTIFRDFDIIFGTFTSSWTIQVINENMIVPIFQTPVGAIFIYAFLITGVNYSVIKNRKKNINKP